MKLPALLFALLSTALIAPAGDAPADLRDLKIGDPAPDFSLPAIDGKTHRLADYQSAKVLMVAFISNHCPDSHAAEDRLKNLVADLEPRGLTVVAINPNNPDGLRLDELGYSKYNDSFEDMQKYAAERGFNFPYLYDGETQGTAKAYGCLATPHVFVFDAARKLRYKGQFDNSRYADPATVKSADARNAVEAILAGQPVPLEVTKPHGCSTKWMEKKGSVATANEKWARTPVELEQIDLAQVAALRKNGTPKLRLFNVWSTTCAPCVKEFPELVTTARKFGLRDFELITISTDEASDRERAKAFLEKQGAGVLDHLKPSLKAEGRTTNNYLFTGADVSGLMAALDPNWPGGFPHTVLVGPGGQIVWSHNGPVDGEELRARVLEKLGPYYLP